MSPERHPCHEDGDGGGGGGGGGTIVGGHVTVETSSPTPSPRSGHSDAPSSSLSLSHPAGSSMVLSTIPTMEASQLILQQHLSHQQQPSQQQQQQQHHIIATSNTSQRENNNTNNNSNISAINAANSAASNHSIIINNNNNNTSFKNHNNNIIISGSSVGSVASGNNHTYTINLSSNHNGHAVIANGASGGTAGVPIHSYSSTTSSSNSGGPTVVNGNYSHLHLAPQHHQQQQQQQSFHHIHPTPNNATIIGSSMATAHSNGISTTSTTTTVVAPQAPSPSSAPTSKLVVLQQGHLGENYITTTEGMNGVGNIVLLATEQMDMSSAEHDLINNNVIISSSNHHGHSHCLTTGSYGGSTNLTNSSSSSSTITSQGSHIHHQQQPHMIRNGTTVLTANGVGGVVLNTDEELTPLTWLHDKNLLKGINLSKVPVSSPDSPRQAGGHLSPTSDFVEDSSVSEDNTSSANSSSDQSIGVYCTEPVQANGRPVPPAAQVQHHTFHLNSGGHKTFTTINGDTIIEYPVATSEEKELKSPSSTVSCASSSSPSSSSSSLYNSSPSPVPISSSSGHTMTSSVHAQNGGSNSGSSTPHTHFHKRYLREEQMKQLKQVNASYVTPVKQPTSNIKYEDGEVIDVRQYPSAPVKNGYTMAASPNVSSDEYSGSYGGSMRPPSPPLSPQPVITAGLLTGIHSLQQQSSVSPQSSPIHAASQHVQQPKLSPPKAKHPTNVPYDPQVHIQSKPPFSFSSLIFMAIENCQQKALPVKEIYAWIVQHFPYFKTAPAGWKNSVRHNLSLNKCFQKVEKAANLGKGSLWMVEPQYRPNLIQALSRSPFHSGSGIDKTTYKAMQQQAQQQAQQQQHQQHSQTVHQRSTDSPTSSVGSSYSKDNFPYLASRLAPADAQNGVQLHHFHGQQHQPSHSQHPDADGDDFSRSSTPFEYEGGEIPPESAPPSGYNVVYSHHGGLAVPPAGSRYEEAPPTGGAVILANGANAPAGGEISTRDWSADTIDDVNAATAMLALKHGPKIFTEAFQNGTPPVITTSPSEDHTYSAGGSLPPLGPSGQSSQNNSDNNSVGNSSDAAYESSEESSQNVPTSDELEEQRRQTGVDALLNLAGVARDFSSSSTIHSMSSSLKRRASSSYEAERNHQQSPCRQLSPEPAHEGSLPPSGYNSAELVQQQPPLQPFHYTMEDHLRQSPSRPKKSKSSSTSHMLKKFKKKASWVR